MPTTPELAVEIFEYALAFGGVGFLVWLLVSDRGRTWRARPPALPAWDVAVNDFLFLGWFMLSVGFVGQLLLRAISGPLSDTASDRHTLELLLYGAMFHLGAALTWPAALIMARWRRAGAPQPAAPALSPSLLLVGCGGFLAYLTAMPWVIGASWLWELFLKTVGLPTERQELVDLFLQTRSPLLLASLVVLALVVAPFSEELVFRAGIFRFLRTRAPRWVAYVVSAGLFAAIHLNWFSLLPLFILGLVFAAAYERTGRITVSMLAHALFNLNTLLLVLSGVSN
jgi:hypothetical protein